MKKNFSAILTSWYHGHKRDLPWRKTTDPYKIWLSEIILQQTQVKQGLAYYYRFIEKYPTIDQLANANLDEILLLWQGLGYYSRARNLHAASKQVMESYNGAFPTTYSEIIKLKGVGEYTAAAIASFAYREPRAVVDGNVFRVLSRIFGISTPIDTGAGKKEFLKLANELINPTNPDIHNQAIMEFGALQCTPKSPDCNNCPFSNQCEAQKHKNVASFPVKSRKIKVKNRYFHYFHIKHKDSIAIEQRSEGDIWARLFQLPMIESADSSSLPELTEHPKWLEIFSNNELIPYKQSELITHQLSHQKLHCFFYHFETNTPMDNLSYTAQKELGNYAFPQLIHNYLHKEYSN